MVINLKRFRKEEAQQSRFSMFSGMGGGMGDKIDDFIDFPMEIDMSKYVTSTDGGTMIYDCYGVSNHYGGMGGGHYTAYCQNPLDKEWYDFDDCSVSKIDKEKVITSAAYNLFFRRRDWHEQNIENGVDF